MRAGIKGEAPQRGRKLARGKDRLTRKQSLGRMADPEVMWTPRGEQTNMDDFRERVNQKFSLSLGMYGAYKH